MGGCSRLLEPGFRAPSIVEGGQGGAAGGGGEFAGYLGDPRLHQARSR